MALKLPRMSLAELEATFAYEPSTGALTWLKPPTNRIAKGSLAGTLRKEGVTVTIRGERFLALYLCWALHHHKWPVTALGLQTTGKDFLDATYGHLPPHEVAGYRRRNLEDLRISNIVDREQTLRQDDDAVERRAAQAAGRREAFPTSLVTRKGSRYPNVRWAEQFQHWEVYHLDPGARPSNHHPLVVIGTAQHLPDAEDIAAGHAEALAVLAAHPYVPVDEDWSITAGANGPNLGYLHKMLAYAPATGIFANRATMLRADLQYGLPRSKVRSVQVSGRRIAAHTLAWLFTHGIWPQRKGIVWLDGNPGNNAIANLAVRASLVDEEWIPLASVPFVAPGPKDMISAHFSALDMRELLSYDPHLGVILYREGTRERGTPVLMAPHKPGQLAYISYYSRHWAAHMMAVFLHTGTWPSRNGVRWLNGVRDDNRLDNLLVRKSDYTT